MISALSDPRSWEEEETRVLESLHRELGRLEPPRALLDVGAGTGRLTWFLKDLVAAADLLEPDAERARAARALSRKVAPAIRVAVYSSERELPARRYDLVLLSHVIQHVAPGEADRLLSVCVRRCRPGGLIYLATVLAENETPEHRISTLDEDAAFIEHIVDEDAFIQEVTNPNPDRLPVRSFRASELEASLQNLGVEPLAIVPFHAASADTDPGRRSSCRDVAVIARKSSDAGK